MPIFVCMRIFVSVCSTFAEFLARMQISARTVEYGMIVRFLFAFVHGEGMWMKEGRRRVAWKAGLRERCDNN